MACGVARRMSHLLTHKTETLMRYLAAELGPQGVRVVGIHTAGVADTLSRAKVQDVIPDGPSPEEIERMIAGISGLVLG
jgi:enoyl-[acyl-carrier-protein] reductase (NADH)